MTDAGEAPEPIFQPGRNCAEIAHADRVELIVDGKRYFARLKAALEQARTQIIFVGWDFDTRVSLDGGRDSESLRAFIDRLLRTNRTLRIYILKWNFGALKILLRGRMIFTVLRWMASRRLHLKLDGAHPAGASHHQKLVVVDRALAFCGGIDVTSGRWDSRGHSDANPRRIAPDGQEMDPWHDMSFALDGEAAERLHDLAYDRWYRATGKVLPKIEARPQWPFDGPATFESVRVAIARTRGEYRKEPAIRESEALFLDMIASARRFIYAENQYFASRRIAAAIARRMNEPDPPEVVIVMPKTADGWLEQVAMDTARSQLVALLDKVDTKGRFRIYHPYTDEGTPVYVHAKLTIVDDRIIRVGSSNMNNRSLGFDSECDIAIDSAFDGGAPVASRIREIRTDLLAEHLGVPVETVVARLDRGSMIETIEALRGPGHSLRPFEQGPNADLAEIIASNNLLDPEGEEDGSMEKMAIPRWWWQ